MSQHTKESAPISVEHITGVILVLRGHKVLLDTELAALYNVSTKRFNEQVRRNRERFPDDFMFQLTSAELAVLRSQIATLDSGRGKHHAATSSQAPAHRFHCQSRAEVVAGVELARRVRGALIPRRHYGKDGETSTC
jgi:hypothetical protein